jgi:hypothetical protein
VRKKINIFCSGIVLLLLLYPSTISSQILRDSVYLNMIKNSADKIYNFQFKDAQEVSKQLKQAYPEHPVIYIIDALITFWSNYPLAPSSPACISFEKDLRKCIELCGKRNSEDDEAEYLLANLSARGMLLLFYTDNNMSMDVIPLAASTYQYIRRSFNFTAVYNDFFFFTGLYNYSREAYPEAYPVYKPLALLFPKGDKIKGLKELEIVARNSILYKAESSSFLSLINLVFENNFEQAYRYSKTLHELYPYNLQYLGVYFRNMLLVKQYEEAERLFKSSVANFGNAYFQAQLAILNGILQEKKHHNDKLAEQYYSKGVRDLALFGYYGNEFAAYGYFGLSRISERRGESNYKKTYRKKGNELAEFKNINFDE